MLVEILSALVGILVVILVAVLYMDSDQTKKNREKLKTLEHEATEKDARIMSLEIINSSRDEQISILREDVKKWQGIAIDLGWEPDVVAAQPKKRSSSKKGKK